MNKLIKIVSMVVLIVSCGKGNVVEDRQEVLSSVRGLGVMLNPLTPVFSTAGEDPKKIELKLYSTVPTGVEAAVSPYIQSSTSGSTGGLKEEDIQIDSGTLAYEDHHGFRIVTISATVNIPESDKLKTNDRDGSASLDYGFKIEGGGDTEYLTGSFQVYPADSSEISSITAPTVQITAPVQDASVDSKEVTISLSYTEIGRDRLSPGWFVSGGSIDDRRKNETKWHPGSSGDYSLVATIRGQRTGGFAIQVVDVVAQ